MLKIRVNGETIEVDDGVTVRGILDRLGIEPVNIAIEHNGTLLDEGTDLDGVRVTGGDSLEIVGFVGGG